MAGGPKGAKAAFQSHMKGNARAAASTAFNARALSAIPAITKAFSQTWEIMLQDGASSRAFP